ncbi:MAG: HsdR family type I site-specific deoxyribonuclease [candidate division Zixibacteria bacterium]|nr:HsdR family type I site-specific deoxyribonuclease [candidate division Zixibacteria bacterium]
MAKLGVERTAVQAPLVQYACEIGWEYVGQEEALRLRGGKTGLLFKEVFTDQILKLNSDFIDHLMIEEIIKKLERLPARIEGNLQAWEYLRGLKTVFVPDEKRERNVKFIDEDIKSNGFHVTDEFEFTNGTHTNRYDVVFLINGVPVFFVETKAAHKLEGIQEGLDQVRRYHRETPEAMTLFQIYTLTHIIQFFYSATWNYSHKTLFNWKRESQEKDFENLVKAFFDRKAVVGTLLKYILFTRQDDELKKVILRPHQMRAVEKIVERAAHKIKHKGLIWHTQGSGKTYTMIVAAQAILENPLFENPTVILLVDRNELETQLFGNLSSVGFEDLEDRIIKSKKHLRELLENDTRGLIVSMIHKFEGMPQNVNTRKNVFVLVDEAHRTTTGDLGNYLMGALPNATYIGFTGTPIDKTAYGKGTFIVFGKEDPPKGYLDKYGMAESIEDGTTVKLHYSLAPSELRPEKAVLEKEFLSLAEAEGISDIEVLNKVLERAVTLRNMLKNKERVRKVADYVVKHFKEYVEPMGYKAFLVAVDREACALYKEELDKRLPKECSEVVFSPFHEDEPQLRKYHLSEETEKAIRKAFRVPDKLPKILIVTEKLLTGFDAPILYCMYLDKPMRDHVLLQAIARVNRPYEDGDGRKKTCGFVLDFIGIFDNLEKALAFDSGDVSGVVKDIEILKERFASLMKTARVRYLKLIEGKNRDKAVEAVLEHFKDEDERHTYYGFFKETADIYEVLSPDAFLRPFIDEFDTLARMYRIVREAYDPGIPVDREFTRKTAKLVQEHTKSGVINSSLEVYEINEHTLKKLEDNKASDTEKVFNLLRSIGLAIKIGEKTAPYLISIGEKAELISKLFIQRQKDTQETLEELKRLIEEINSAKREQEKKKMPVDIFSAYWVLKEQGIPEPEVAANEIQEVFEKYPFWKTTEEYERKVKQHILKILGKSKLNVKLSVELTTKIIRILKGV